MIEPTQEAAAFGIIRLLRLAQDSALRQRLGCRGRQFVQERFGVQRMVDDLYQLYLRLGGHSS